MKDSQAANAQDHGKRPPWQDLNKAAKEMGVLQSHQSRTTDRSLTVAASASRVSNKKVGKSSVPESMEDAEKLKYVERRPILAYTEDVEPPPSPAAPNSAAVLDDVQAVPHEEEQPAQRAPVTPGAFRQGGTRQMRQTGISDSNFTVNNTSEALYSTAFGNGEGSPSLEAGSHTTSNRGLVEANPLRPSEIFSSKDLELAEPVDEEGEIEERHARQKKRMRSIHLSLAGIALLLTGVVGIIVFAVTKSSPNKSTAHPETSAPTLASSTTVDPLWELLPGYTQFTISSDKIGNKPQSLAYQWMLQDTNIMEYSSSRLLQRFALATFYYATGGDHWKYKGGEGMVTVVLPGQDQGNPNVQEPGGGGRPPWQGGPPNGGRPPWQGGGPGGPPPGGPPPGFGSGSGPPGGGNNSVPFGSPFSGDRPREGPQSPPVVVNIERERWLGYDSNECEWFSTWKGESICEQDNQTLLVLDLQMNELKGLLPEEIGLLTSLERLSLHDNQVRGPLIAAIGHLTNLKELVLSTNQITGIIPTAMGMLSGALQEFSVIENSMWGLLPAELYTLSNLVQLKLGQNGFTGTLPKEFGDWMPNLGNLKLARNSFNGTLPESMGKLTDLYGMLSFAENSFTGQIPTEVGLLTNVFGLVLEWNQLTGPLPSELALLSGLGNLGVGNNPGLSGSIPRELNLLNSTLKDFTFSNTGITGRIPSGVCNVGKLEFDCSAMLCGCSTCPCFSFNSSI